MENYVDELLKLYLGSLADESVDQMALEDEELLSAEAEVTRIDEQFMAMDLAADDRMVVDDYLEALQAADNRRAELSYIAGVRNTIKLLHSLNLLKGLNE